MKPGIAFICALLLTLGSGELSASPVARVVPVHPLEQKALNDPANVLKALPGSIAASQRNKDSNELALLYLAQTNACRVLANWRCQRSAAQAADVYAAQVNNTLLQVKAKIQQARAVSALGDYNLASNLLTDANNLLARDPNGFLSAEIFLAYSSIGHQLGRYRDSANFSAKGIAKLEGAEWLQRSDDDPLRVRLMRNLGRAQGQLGNHSEAIKTLKQANELVEKIDDPKLRAELMIELNRVATQSKDLDLMKQTADQILQFAGQVKNTQLTGMGYEAEASYALAQSNPERAREYFTRARSSFNQLGLQRDELRVLKNMIPLYSGQVQSQQLALDALELSNQIAIEDRKETSDDFAQRVAYMQEVGELEKQRAQAELVAQKNKTTRQELYTSLALAGIAIMIAAFFALRSRWQRQQAQTVHEAQNRRHRVMLGTSHDIRNSLMTINGAVDLLLLRQLPSGMHQYLQKIRAAGDNLQGLAQDLLDSERLELGKINLQIKATNVRELVANLVEIHKPQADKRNLRMRLDWDNRLPDAWMIDSLRLHRVLSNLISNALKFTDTGSIDVHVSKVDVGQNAPENFVAQFSVRDSGCGISRHDQERLFLPFEKGKQGERFATGVGLGLSIARELVQLMGGKLQLVSEPGKGSTFYFSLQSVRANDEDIARAQPSQMSSEEKPLRVLLVEDEPISRELVTIFLEQSGCLVRSAVDIGKAMSELSLSQFDVLITDYELADGTGIDLIQKMRGLYSGSGHRCASVILSGHAPSEERGEKLVDKWLIKPVSAEIIVRTVRRLFH